MLEREDASDRLAPQVAEKLGVSELSVRHLLAAYRTQ